MIVYSVKIFDYRYCFVVFFVVCVDFLYDIGGCVLVVNCVGIDVGGCLFWWEC